MKKIFLVFISIGLLQNIFAQPGDDVKQMRENAQSFLRSGDYDNAILVLNRALQKDKNSLELQKDLVQAYYYKILQKHWKEQKSLLKEKMLM